MKKNNFFSKVRRSDAANGARPSRLRLETLEERQLLSVTDVAPIILADSANDDIQYVGLANATEAPIDLGAVLNTTASVNGSSATIYESDVINGCDGFVFTNVTTNPNTGSVEKVTIQSVPTGVTSLTLSGFTSASELYANSLGLTELKLPGMRDLTTLQCSNNSLTELDLSASSRLLSVDCSYNNLATLDLSNNHRVGAVIVDYDVERLFLWRQPGDSSSEILLSLTEVPANAVVQVTHSDPNAPDHGTISPTSQNSYQYDLNGNVSAQTGFLAHRDSIHVKVDNELTMAINPLFKLEADSGSVVAVVGDNSELTRMTLFKNILTNAAVTVDDFSFAIRVDDASNYFEVASDANGPYLKYKGGLDPEDSPYAVTITATKNGGANGEQTATESFRFWLTVDKGTLDPADNLVATPGLNSATLTWRGVEHASHYEIKCDGQTVETINGASSSYITETDPATGLNLYSYTVTNLEPGTAYSFTVTPHREFMNDPDPAEILQNAANATTLTPRIAVTIQGDELDHTNDFDDQGNPANISLREAYDYVDCYYVGGNWTSVPDGSVIVKKDDGSYVFTDNLGKTRTVFKTIKFDVSTVYVENEIVVGKSLEIGDENSAVTIYGVDPQHADDANYVAAHGTRVFKVDAGGTITAKNVSLKKGYAKSDSGDSTSGRGGAIYIASGGTYVADGGSIDDNTAEVYGGGVYVVDGGRFEAENGASFQGNEAVRGGAIWNKGYVGITGSSSFVGNIAATRTAANDSPPANGSFGGAIYNNGGNVYINTTDSAKTTFRGNQATSPETPASLNGYSGGAIYNSKGTVEVKNAEFTSNFAGKYGGAISNFATLNVENTTFSSNSASAGGAVQNAGNATFTNATFGGSGQGNTAVKSQYILVNDTTYGPDYGGNGGAIFQSNASGSTGSTLVLNGATFAANTAANAGGAIDTISGKTTFNGTFSFNGNTATVVGGAIVVAVENASDIVFTQNLTSSDFVSNSAMFGKTVAASCRLGGDLYDGLKAGFFSDKSAAEVTPDLFDTFVRTKRATSSETLSFAYFADSVGVVKDSNGQVVNIDAIASVTVMNAPTLAQSTVTNVLADGGSINLSDYADGSNCYDVYYYVNDASSYVFKLTINDHNDADIAAQLIDVSNMKGYTDYVGFSFKTFGSDPIYQWIVGWGEGEGKETITNYGFATNAFHMYTTPGEYEISLSVVFSEGGTAVDLGKVASYVVEAETAGDDQGDSVSGAILDEAFADEDLFDDFFIF